MPIRLNTWSTIALGVAAIVFSPRPALAGLADFVGVWVQANPAAHNARQMDIRHDGDRLYFRLWLRCQPTDCNLGEIELHPYVPNNTDLVYAADTAVAVYSSGNIERMVILRPQDGILKYEIFFKFADGSGRANIHSFGGLVKTGSGTSAYDVLPPPPPPPPPQPTYQGPEPRIIFRNDNVTYHQGDRISLRAGISRGAADWDFTLIVGPELQTVGAEAVIVSRDEPNYEICQSRGYTSEDVILNDLSGGNWLCVRMADGSFAKLKFNGTDETDGVSLTIAVWAKK